MRFWVYENWRAHGRRSTVHLASCRFCNDGAGLSGGTGADNGNWHGPFTTCAEAKSRADGLPGTSRYCGACTPTFT